MKFIPLGLTAIILASSVSARSIYSESALDRGCEHGDDSSSGGYHYSGSGGWQRNCDDHNKFVL